MTWRIGRVWWISSASSPTALSAPSSAWPTTAGWHLSWLTRCTWPPWLPDKSPTSSESVPILLAIDVDVMDAMNPFHAAFDAYHSYTKPKDWLEGLLKAYVGDGFAADFYREVAAFVDSETRSLVHEVLADAGHADFVVEKVRAAISTDAKVAGRLALWGRRLVGEALSQAQRVAANRDALTSLLTGTVDRPGMDLAAISRMFTRLVENHARRMSTLGLQS